MGQLNGNSRGITRPVLDIWSDSGAHHGLCFMVVGRGAARPTLFLSRASAGSLPRHVAIAFSLRIVMVGRVPRCVIVGVRLIRSMVGRCQFRVMACLFPLRVRVV